MSDNRPIEGSLEYLIDNGRGGFTPSNATDILGTVDADRYLDEMAFITPRLFGGPIGFRKEVDPSIKVNGTNYEIGRTLSETLLVNPTIVSLCPGKAKYLPWTSNSSRESISNQIMGSFTGDVDSLDINTISEDKMFFSFQADYNNYMNHVNLLARTMSIYLGIGDKNVPGTQKKYKFYNWRHWFDKSSPFAVSSSGDGDRDSLINHGDASEFFRSLATEAKSLVVGDKHYIHFYSTANSSYDESISTNTRQSAIQSKFESQFDDMVKDIRFLTGEAISDSALKDVDKAFAEMKGAGWDKLLNVSKSYLSGHRLIFPQMIDDSSYTKSISLNTRFISPYGDTESVFLNCYLPLAHVLAMSLPKQVENNMFTYPFMVRAFSRGWANCEMGCITGVRIQRGGQEDTSWSASGIPTEIECNIEITPLRSQLMASTTEHPMHFLENDSLQEYLGTICGMNMKKDVVDIKIETLRNIIGGVVMDLPGNVFNSVLEKGTGWLNDLFTVP